MAEDIALTLPDSLRLYQPDRLGFDQLAQTPNEWFVQRYPLAYQNHGSPFLELLQLRDGFSQQILSLVLNHDFFAAVLGGRKDLNHHVIYFVPEMEWYFKDSDNIYKTTTQEKLQNQYRALMMKCAQDMPIQVHKLNLVHEFRSDRNAKIILQRAKSILAADQSYFSATSSNQRIRGPELYERLMRVLCDTMLEQSEGGCLTVSEAYQVFCKLAQQNSLDQIKRSMFKEIMRDLIKDEFGVGLRRDVLNAENKQQEGWRGLKLLGMEGLVG